MTPNGTPAGPPPSATTAPAPAPSLGRGERILFFAVIPVLVLGVMAATWWFTRRPATPVADGARLVIPAGVPGELPLPRPLGDFAFTERSGQTVRRADLQGRFVVLNLIFTSCSASCFAVNYRMAEIQRLTADAPDVQLLSFTVDPRTDTPAALADFAARFKADPKRWWFVTGDKAPLYEFIAGNLAPRSNEETFSVPGGFLQTERLLLADRTGAIVAAFNGTRPDAAGAIVAEINRLRAAGKETPR